MHANVPLIIRANILPTFFLSNNKPDCGTKNVDILEF